MSSALGTARVHDRVAHDRPIGFVEFDGHLLDWPGVVRQRPNDGSLPEYIPGMPSSPLSLFAAAGLEWQGATPWGKRPALGRPGVYILSTAADPATADRPDAPRLSQDGIAELLAARPEMTVNGRPATPELLRAAVTAMWPAGEAVVYVGLAGTSVSTRVGQYFATRLGARSPHAGGWPVKLLANLDALHVHVAPAGNPNAAEYATLQSFMAGVTPAARAALSDPVLPLPFANLELSKGQRKRHGVGGAKAPASATQPRPTQPASAPKQQPGTSTKPESQPPPPTVSCGPWLLNVTATDVGHGRIRVTSEPKRGLGLPARPEMVAIRFRSQTMIVAFDPRNGPDRARSGVLSIGKARLQDLAGGPVSLTAKLGDDGVPEFD